MSHSLSPTSASLNTGTTYEFKATISSSYNVASILYSLMFWDSADGGFDHIMHDYTTYVDGEDFYNDTRSYSKTVTVPSQAKRASLSISYTENGSAEYGEQIYSFSTSATLGKPGTPTIGTDGNGNYTVSWTAASASGGSGNVSYVVHYGPEDTTVSAGTATSKTIAIPANYYNTAISFFIEASYSGLTTTSNSSSYTATRADLSAPSNVNLNSTTSYGSNVTLSWTAPANASNNHLTGFYVDRREYDGSSWGSWGTLATGLSASTTSLSVAAPPTVNHQYQFRVTATGQASNSGPTVSSNTVTTIYGAMPAPSNVALSATTSYGEQVTLSWVSGGNGTNNALTGYVIERRESDGTTYGAWTTVQSGVSKDTTSMSVDVPAVAGHIYQYRVTALGTYSNANPIETTNTVTAIYGTLPAPTNVSLDATISYGEQVTLSWESSGDGQNNALVGYEVERREHDGSTYGGWTILQTNIPKTTTSIEVDVPPTANHQYHFRVKALGTYSNSSTTDSSNFVTRLIQSKCSVPSTFKATEVRSNNKYFYLTWEGALGGENNRITGYEIQTCTSLNNGLTYDSWVSLGVFSPDVSSLHLVAPTVRWTRYKYRIQVRGSAGASYYSNWKELSEAVMRPSPEIQEELFANGITHVKINGQWTTDTAHLYTTQWDTI